MGRKTYMPSARIGFFILTIFLAASAGADEDILEQLQLINRQIRLNSKSCTQETSPFNTRAPARKFCDAIKSVAASEVAHVCTPFYRNGRPHWEDPAMKLQLQSYGTQQAIAKSRNKFSKEGYSVASPAQEAELLSKLNRFRNEMIRGCCGADLACQQGIQSVKLRLCKDSAAQGDPNAPDSCTLVDGYYQSSTNPQDRYRILKSIYAGARTAADRAYVFSLTKVTEVDVEEKFRELGITPSQQPVSGEIVVSPYFQRGIAKITDQVVRHELAHACSSVKRQVSAIRGENASALSLAVQQRTDNSCNLNPKAIDAYSDLFTDLREHRGLSECLYKIASESTVPGSYGYVEGSCPGSKLEEGFAIARAVMSAPPPLVPKTFPNRECSGNPSTKHPAAAAVADCLVRHSTTFRDQLLGEFRCRR